MAPKRSSAHLVGYSTSTAVAERRSPNPEFEINFPSASPARIYPYQPPSASPVNNPPHYHPSPQPAYYPPGSQQQQPQQPSYQPLVPSTTYYAPPPHQFTFTYPPSPSPSHAPREASHTTTRLRHRLCIPSFLLNLPSPTPLLLPLLVLLALLAAYLISHHHPPTSWPPFPSISLSTFTPTSSLPRHFLLSEFVLLLAWCSWRNFCPGRRDRTSHLHSFPPHSTHHDPPHAFSQPGGCCKSTAGADDAAADDDDDDDDGAFLRYVEEGHVGRASAVRAWLRVAMGVAGVTVGAGVSAGVFWAVEEGLVGRGVWDGVSSGWGDVWRWMGRRAEG